jgi:GTP-binding protein EngB required for normal cell division
MFNQQIIITQAVPTLKPLIARYGGWQPASLASLASPEWLNHAAQKAAEFFVPVPLVGAFSAGKSTLINALLDEPLLSTAITPETAIPAELRHSETTHFMGRTPDGKRISISREAIESNNPDMLNALGNGGVLEIALPISKMANMPHIQLVDMPGWESSTSAHSTAIDGYAPRALAYGIVVSAEEGTLHQSIREALQSLKAHHKPVFAIISKTDKKPAEDVDAIAKLVEQSIEKTLGRAPFMTVKTSARKRQITEVLKALQLLENQSETLFSYNVVQDFRAQLQGLEAHIHILLNTDDLNSESITAQRENLQSDMASFVQKLQTETQQLNAKIPSILRRLEVDLKNTLTHDVDNLANRATNGSDWNNPMKMIIRQCTEKILREDFADGMNAYLGNIQIALPQSLAVTKENASNSKPNNAEADEDITEKSIGAAALALSQLPIPMPPQIKVGLLVLGTVLSFFGGNKKSESVQSREIENPEAQQRARIENIKIQLLHTIIPEAVNQGINAVRPILEQHIQNAQHAITAQVQAKQHSTQAALDTLQTQLTQSQAVRAEAVAQYHADINTLESIITQLT